MNDHPASRKLRGTKKRAAEHVPKAPEPSKTRVLQMDRPDTDSLRRVTGSKRDVFNLDIINATLSCLWDPAGQSDDQRARQGAAAVLAMMAFKVGDEIEAMLVAQAMAMHHAAMECSRRAMVRDQPAEFAQGFRKAAANASRTFVELLAALDRKRGKGGQQVVRVEHVHVHPGGQAIVGTITTGGQGGGGATETREEPHEPHQLAHGPKLGAGIPPLLCADPQRGGVPGAGDAEPAVLPARGKQHRTNGSGN
jgi:hypothetical protein